MVRVCPAFTSAIRMARYNTVLFVPSDDFSIPSKSMNSGPLPAVMDLSRFGKSLSLNKLQVYLVNLFDNAVIAKV